MPKHRLDTADLRALATGPVSVELVHRLRSAELSRHLILLEAVRREAAAAAEAGDLPRAEFGDFERVLSALARLQRTSPALVRGLLSLPQIGAWAGRCLAGFGSGRPVDLGYPAGLMARALRDTDGAGMTGGIPVRVRHGGLTLHVVLDHADPHLDLYGPRAGAPSSAEIRIWRERLSGAWRSIVRHDPLLAAAIAAGLTTVVPLREGPEQRPHSATSGWAFGAIALSLPPDDSWCADTLVHEFRHVLLGAVCDHLPLWRPSAGRLAYAPWREDPRPAPGLLFGCHAYVGLLDFWRRQSGETPAAKFARWLQPTAEAVDSPALTETLTREGALLVAAMRKSLDAWRVDLRPSHAGRLAEDAAADHRLRWRLRHLRPRPEALDALADAWSAGARPLSVPTEIVSGPIRAMAPAARSRLLEWEAGADHRRASPPLPDAAARAMLDGRYAAAAAEYKARIAEQGDPDAWAGLALCRLRSDGRSALASRPEVVASLYDRLSARTGAPADPDDLGAWLAGDQVIMGSTSSETRPR